MVRWLMSGVSLVKELVSVNLVVFEERRGGGEREGEERGFIPYGVLAVALLRKKGHFW